MAALNDKQSKELCRKIEQSILKNGYFIFDTGDWDGLHIEYKSFTPTHNKIYEYADYTEITITFDDYNVTDKLEVKYNFIKSTYVGQTGDSYRVYYKREDGKIDGSGRQYSMNEAAEFIADRFIGLVEDKIMNKKLEERVARLEHAISRKDELFGFGKLTSADGKSFINKLFNKYPSLLDIFGNYSPSSSKKTFNIVLTAPNGKPYNGTSFVISTNGGRKEVYINATDKYNVTLGVIRNLNIDTDINKIASFILSTLSNTATESHVTQKRRRCKNEEVSLTTFDCESLRQMVEDNLDDLHECEIDITDDNADYGHVNVGIYNPNYVTDYDIIANDVDSFEIINDDKKLGEADSLDDAADMLCDHFMDNYINGKFKK